MSQAAPARFAVANGAVVPEAQALVPAASPAVLFGAGVFDTVKCGPGVLYWLSEHIARFLGFCQELEIPVRRSPDKIAADARACLAANTWGPPALKILATLRAEDAADLFVVVAERRGYPSVVYERGASLAVSPDRQNERGGLAGKKTLNYFERYLARRAATRREVLDWLYLDTRGNVSEGTFLNVFWVRDGAVRTPAPSAGILAGITRTVALDILMREKTPVSEGLFPLADLLAADEAFLTSSVLEVAPLIAVDGVPIGTGSPGPLTRRLMDLYRRERDARGATAV